MTALKFQLMDTRGWEREFDATDIKSFVQGVQLVWTEYRQDHPDEMDPRFAHRAKSAEIREWLREQSSRPGTTDAQLAQPEKKAAKMQQKADRTLIKLEHTGEGSPLHLKVWACGTWVIPVEGTGVYTAPRVPANLTDERAESCSSLQRQLMLITSTSMSRTNREEPLNVDAGHDPWEVLDQ